jgi:hypothetical protein
VTFNSGACVERKLKLRKLVVEQHREDLRVHLRPGKSRLRVEKRSEEQCVVPYREILPDARCNDIAERKRRDLED